MLAYRSNEGQDIAEQREYVYGVTESLKQRELDILRLLSDGLTDREIGQRIGLALNTVKWYNKRIYRKLGVNNRTQAVSRAQSLGLLDWKIQSEKDRDSPPTTFTTSPSSNLPKPVTSFIGRQKDIDAVMGLIENARLITITGPTGSGKTRLALRVATNASSSFRDGVFFVPFRPVTQTDNLVWVIAEHIKFQFDPHGAPLDQILNYFEERELLLVLDNFEHLTDYAEVLVDILMAAPKIKMLVTSLERLNLYGEVNYTIGGMTLPDTENSDDVARTEAVELFLERAQSVNPKLNLQDDDLQHVARICQLVEGLPLGIELAATWVDVLSPQEIGDEIEDSLNILETNLRGVPHTQASMRAAFDRSWKLLNAGQQAAFRRLSIFGGGFTHQAADRVAGVDLRTLQTLVAKSLLHTRPDNRRFEMHQLLHHYATEKLEETNESHDIRAAHATYFAHLMAERWPQLKGSLQQSALREIEADIENVRAAWMHLVNTKNVAGIKQMMHTLWVIYDIRGWYPAGIELFEKAIKMMRLVSTEQAEQCLGWLLAVQGLYHAVGGFYNVEGGYRSGFELTQRGVDILKRLDQHNEMMIVPLISLCITATQLNKRQEALEAAQTCLKIATDIGDQWGVAKAKQFLAIQAIGDRSYEQAERKGLEALDIFEKSGDRWSESVLCIEVLGLLAITRHDLEKAARWVRRGLKSAEKIGFDYSIQMAYWQLGYIEALGEDYSKAGTYWQKGLEVGGDHILGTGVTIGFGGTSSGDYWSRRK